VVWPNVVLESLACGTPVVATDVWGTPEIISSPTVGILSKIDEKAFAMALEDGLARSWDRAKIVQFARNHGWEQVAILVLNVFKKSKVNKS
jgi:glycosyltransferase involved in cell wall biosynthesis